MPTTKEKGRPEGSPIPNAVVYHDSAELNKSQSDTQADFAQALTRSVFGHDFLVVHKPLGSRFRTRRPSRIRAWRYSQ
jgi:hypothetical protein